MAEQPPAQDSNRDSLGFDEWIALFVAFSVMGALLWWSLGRRSENAIAHWISSGNKVEQTTPTSGEVASPGVADAAPAAVDLAPPPTTPPPQGVVNPSSQKGAVPEAIAAAPTTTTTAPAPTDLAPAAAPTTTGPVPTAIRVPAAGNRPLTFPDLPTSHWAYPFIKELARRGMVTGVGDGTFKPDQPVNRAQYVALLNEVLSGTRQGQSPFKDVQRGFWATEAIGAAVQAGFIKGYPDQTFQPGVPMTKMQVLLSLANGFQLPKPVETNRSLQALRDGEQIPAWAKPAIAAATEAGVVVNYPDINQFHPNQVATRAEVVTMVYQALKTTGQLPAIQSPYIFKPSIVQP